MQDASTYPLEKIKLGNGKAAEFAPRVQWTAAGDQATALAANTSKAAAAPVAAYANQGRWVVECPDCHGAQLAAKDDRRFMCCDCGNAGIGGLWRPVLWPDDAELVAIEKLLDERPQKAAQSWVPGETVTQLEVENYDVLGLRDKRPPVTPIKGSK